MRITNTLTSFGISPGTYEGDLNLLTHFVMVQEPNWRMQVKVD